MIVWFYYTTFPHSVNKYSPASASLPPFFPSPVPNGLSSRPRFSLRGKWPEGPIGAGRACPGPSSRPRPREESKGGSADPPFCRFNEGGPQEGEKPKSSPPECRFLWLLSFGQAKESSTVPPRKAVRNAKSGRTPHRRPSPQGGQASWLRSAERSEVFCKVLLEWDRGRFLVPTDPAQLNP